MKKKIIQIEKDYEEKIKDKSEEEIVKIQEDILEKCKEKVVKENKIFYDEKLKNYEKFKNTSLDNKSGILKLKKILLLRTHSKKTKRRGRKRKNNLVNDEAITIPKAKLRAIKRRKISKKTKKSLSKKNKTKKEKIDEEFDIENKNDNIIPLKEEEENIEKKDVYSFMNQNEENSYIKQIKETPTFPMNKYIDIPNIQNRVDIINEKVQKENINDNKLLFSILRRDSNTLNNSNSNSNLNSHQRTNCDSTDIKNPTSTKAILNKFINNNFQNLNGVISNKGINMNVNMNINMNINNIQSSSGQKSNNSNSPSDLKDIKLATPIKLCQTSGVPGAYKPFHKNEGAFNYISTDNALEKSAFNKQVIIDTPFPYSNIKTHLCFTSSIKKPVKIISYDNNNQEQHSSGSGKKNNSNSNININNYFHNIENMTPNKVIELSGSGSSDGLRFKNIGYSSSKKPECLNLNSSGRILNNPFNDFTPNKNIPFKISNANLDKMYFSNLNSKAKS